MAVFLNNCLLEKADIKRFVFFDIMMPLAVVSNLWRVKNLLIIRGLLGFGDVVERAKNV